MSMKVRSVLDSIRKLHQQLAARYRELEQTETDERLKLLLTDMEQREKKFDDCIDQYEREQHPDVLETWLKFVPEEALQIHHIAERLAQPRSLDDLVEETMRLNAALREAYQALAREAPIPAVGDLFADLAHMEENNDCHYAKALLDA